MLVKFSFLVCSGNRTKYYEVMQEMCLLLSCFRFDTSPIDGDYRVIDVDYDKFAVVYSCTQLLFLKYELGWILTRDQIVNQSLVR